MAALKTQKNEVSVEAFLNSVEHDKRRSDGFAILELMREVTGIEPSMWGASIVDFGTYRYKYASGREAEWMLAGFDRYEEWLSRLGRYRTGKACLYINKLEDVDIQVLRELVRQSVAHMKKTNARPHG